MSHFGEKIECPGKVFVRLVCLLRPEKTTCSGDHVPPMEIKCDKTVMNTTSLKFCNCDHDLCNQDWMTAGSTTTLSSSTFDPPTTVDNFGEKLNFNIAFVFVISITLMFSHWEDLNFYTSKRQNWFNTWNIIYENKGSYSSLLFSYFDMENSFNCKS